MLMILQTCTKHYHHNACTYFPKLKSKCKKQVFKSEDWLLVFPSLSSLRLDNYHQYYTWAQTVQQTTNGDTLVSLSWVALHYRWQMDLLHSECWTTASAERRAQIKDDACHFLLLAVRRLVTPLGIYTKLHGVKHKEILLHRLRLPEKSISNCGTIHISEV